VHEFVRRENFDYAGTLALAFLASERNARHLPALRAALDATNAVQRYWGAHGCVLLGESARPAVPPLQKLLGDPHVANRITAATALYALGERDAAAPVLVRALEGTGNHHAVLLTANTLSQLDALNIIPPAWIERVRNDAQADGYLKRLADRLSR
jgi:hypothetical protein